MPMSRPASLLPEEVFEREAELPRRVCTPGLGGDVEARVVESAADEELEEEVVRAHRSAAQVV